MSAKEKGDEAGKVESSSLKTNEQKWTKPLMEAGWTAFPSIIIECQHQLGLTPTDMNILLHLASRWWTADGKPHPAKGTMAQALGLHPRTIQRRIAALEKAGLIRREERRSGKEGSQPNAYHFDGLIEAAQPFAEEKLGVIEEKKAAAKARAARKGRPKLRVVKSE